MMPLHYVRSKAHLAVRELRQGLSMIKDIKPSFNLKNLSLAHWRGVFGRRKARLEDVPMQDPALVYFSEVLHCIHAT